MDDLIQQVRQYHKATKHRFSGYAPSPGFLDWDSQPNPFREYTGSPRVVLPLINHQNSRGYHALFSPVEHEPAPLNLNSLGHFFELAFGISAWKSTGMDRWALRNNPSSGNLHPTEAYLVLWQAIDDRLQPGIYHYVSRDHALEQVACFNAARLGEIPVSRVKTRAALALTSIHWREEWKYGARAYRYCQHDVGHALACARFAAGVLGWTIAADSSATDDDLNKCLGLQRYEGDVEPECADLIAPLYFSGEQSPTPSPLWEPGRENFWGTLSGCIERWQGEANILSAEHAHWPQIKSLLPSVYKKQRSTAHHLSGNAGSQNLSRVAESPSPAAAHIIRQRRSAQRMQLGTGIAASDFYRAMARTLPTDSAPPFDAFPFKPAVNLVLFVHAVESLEPGLYALIRTPDLYDGFRKQCHQSFNWEKAGPEGLPLYRLHGPGDCRKPASQLSCYQGIAGHSAFSLGMMANMGETLAEDGAWRYRSLFWEAGMIGQLLYLEAEASGLQATGIGCYFDDEVHELFGLEAEGDWQSLYHFTVGAAKTDNRLLTEPAYGKRPYLDLAEF